MISLRTLISAACTLLLVADDNVHDCLTAEQEVDVKHFCMLSLQLMSVHICLSAARPTFLSCTDAIQPKLLFLVLEIK